jgi:hypothetical protein
MTTKITVSVNGNYKIPVIQQGQEAVWVSGRGHEGPNVVEFSPNDHGDGTTFLIGPEEPDEGEPEVESTEETTDNGDPEGQEAGESTGE